jgi:hypothetical protein
MKKILATLALASLICVPIGCKQVNANTPPNALIPGASNQFDQDTYRALATAHAFAQQAASNPAVLSAVQKKVLNQFISDLNAADLLYAAYHSGTATQAAMQSELTQVQADQTSYANAGVK